MLSKSLQQAAGNAGGEAVYVEDVFSTYLYTGNGAAQTITNRIDLAGEGGLVWFKNRGATVSNLLFDSERGVTKFLISNLTNAEATSGAGERLTSFNSDGFSLGADFGSAINASSNTYVSWTFRKAEKFFDVVTFTTDASGQATFSHGLGSIPGFVIFKRTDDASAWYCYHRSLTSTSYFVSLNTTGAQVNAGAGALWSFTDTSASVGVSAGTPFAANAQHVAYLFAHDAGGFGADGSENVISCGSYTGTGSVGNAVNLGFEPQWLLVKRTTSGDDWVVVDNMRGIYGQASPEITSPFLRPNLPVGEAEASYFRLTANGFELQTTGQRVNASGNTYVYIAIRRPMKVPESGTEVFTPLARNGTGTNVTVTGIGFAPDFLLTTSRDPGLSRAVSDRLRGGPLVLFADSTGAEGNYGANGPVFGQDGVSFTSSALWNNTYSSTPPSYYYINYFLGRAPGFFDVVCYTGTGSATTQAHNLSVAPELIIVKRRNVSGNEWVVYTSNGGISKLLFFNLNDGYFNDPNLWVATPTSAVFSLPGTTPTYDVYLNQSGGTYVAYLFATLAGVSKVGSYTGTGTTQQIDCGFAAGARFVLIKRTDSTGDWYVWDTARGIPAGNDPYLLLNSTAAEVTGTDYIDPYAAGFEISSTAPAAINASGGTFIYLAIA